MWGRRRMVRRAQLDMQKGVTVCVCVMTLRRLHCHHVLLDLLVDFALEEAADVGGGGFGGGAHALVPAVSG